MPKPGQDFIDRRNIFEPIWGWLMVFLTLGLFVLYALALFGKLTVSTDVVMLSRLEPILFVIIGYYFGRVPAQENERTLKQEFSRQTLKVDACQAARESLLQSREALDEKIKNARTVLMGDGPRTTDPEALNHRIFVALQILDS